MPPMLMGGLRWTVAGGLLAVYMMARGEGLPGLPGWRHALVLGFLMLVLGNGGSRQRKKSRKREGGKAKHRQHPSRLRPCV